jgi:hypothetical protein
MQSLCTLRHRCRQRPRNTRYQAGATPYLGRTCTGWIAPACGWRTHSITSSARASSGTVIPSAFAVLRLNRPAALQFAGAEGAVTEPRSAESLQQQSRFNLRAIAANTSELLRSVDKPPLAELPFFIGCQRVTQTIYFLTRHF